MENEDEDRSTEHSWKETKEKIAEKNTNIVIFCG